MEDKIFTIVLKHRDILMDTCRFVLGGPYTIKDGIDIHRTQCDVACDLINFIIYGSRYDKLGKEENLGVEEIMEILEKTNFVIISLDAFICYPKSLNEKQIQLVREKKRKEIEDVARMKEKYYRLFPGHIFPIIKMGEKYYIFIEV